MYNMLQFFRSFIVQMTLKLSHADGEAGAVQHEHDGESGRL